jgi:hypothetical protein
VAELAAAPVVQIEPGGPDLSVVERRQDEVTGVEEILLHKKTNKSQSFSGLPNPPKRIKPV